MNYKLLFICSFFVVSCSNKKEVNQYMHPNTITTSTHDFIPSEFNCSLGDTVYFILGPSHDMIQVNEINFNKNTPYPLKGGFNLGFGKSSFFIPTEAKKYYFVCATHLPKMKLTINVK